MQSFPRNRHALRVPAATTTAARAWKLRVIDLGMKKHRACLLCVALLLPGALFAGSGDGANLSARAQTDPTKEDIGDIHPDGEGGILSRFRVNASMRGEYTSNARVQGHHGSPD